jgi:hypothetical protein
MSCVDDVASKEIVKFFRRVDGGHRRLYKTVVDGCGQRSDYKRFSASKEFREGRTAEAAVAT